MNWNQTMDIAAFTETHLERGKESPYWDTESWKPTRNITNQHHDAQGVSW